jgi:hypothetical protein
MFRRRLLLLIVPVAWMLILVACGGSKREQAPNAQATSAPATDTGATGRAAPSGRSTTAGALQAEAQSAGTGDIPDDQVFLVFQNRTAGYSIKYPEGWAKKDSGDRVTFRDKNNIVRVLVSAGPATTLARVRAEMRRLAGAHVTKPPASIALGRGHVIKVVYTTESATNPVTGKHVTLVVDRYYLEHSGKRAIIDLGTPQGVDNVDAYRLMIESFRWR